MLSKRGRERERGGEREIMMINVNGIVSRN
jgi:hypothetical protein